MSDEIIHLNGRLLPASEACVSIADHGFLYADGLFETVRSYDGRPFRLNRHLERLFSSAKLIALTLPLTKEQFTAVVLETMAANDLLDARIRITVTRSAGKPGMLLDPQQPPTILITAHPLALPSAEKYAQGWTAAVVSERRNSQSLLSSIKTLNYLPGRVATMQARVAGAEEPILLNERGLATEGASSNLFLVMKGELVTPDLQSGILPGITRAVVLEIASRLGLQAVERQVLPDDLRQADEVFLTSSVVEFRPIVSIDGHAVGAGMPGPVTQSVMAGYREETAQVR